MPLFLARLLAQLAVLRSWATPIIVIVVVFGTSWPLMAAVEPAGSALVQPGNYWWYFVVTAATVGYGDLAPTTAAGHLIGGYVIVGGIAALTTVFTNLAAMLEQARGRRMRGTISVADSDHIVLLGYTSGRSERLVEELRADGEQVVLCAWEDVGTHPMREHGIDFVRGDLTDDRVLRRAGVHRARAVLVDARDDNESLAVAVTVDHLRPDAHLVVAVRDLAKASLLSYVNDRVRCVQWHSPHMITEELISPGIADVYSELMTHGGENTYSLALPASLGAAISVDRCRTALARRHGATLLAARVDGRLLVNPHWQAELPPGAVVYYIAADRLTSAQLHEALTAAPEPAQG